MTTINMRPRPWLDWSYDQAEMLFRAGYLSKRNWKTYCRVWDWACPRLSRPANDRQYAYAQKWGQAALTHRMNRLRRVLGLDLIPDNGN